MAFNRFAPGKKEQIFRLRELLKENGSEGWEQAWKEGVTPWDEGEPQPPLRHLFESEDSLFRDVPKKGKLALVPGCGVGYDAAYLASLGYNAWGVDLSEKAIAQAEERFADQKSQLEGTLTFKALDFFDFEVPKEKFSLIYDYTFFCAIPPALRASWGTRLSTVTTPGGYLITLVYPIDGAREGGPPFSVDVSLYEKVLPSDKWRKVYEGVSPVSHESKKDNEKVVVWVRLHEEDNNEGVAKI